MKLPIFIFVLLFCSVPVTALAEPDARGIVRKTDNLLRGETSQAAFEMTVTTPNWSRTMKGESCSAGHWDKAFVRISAPVKDAGSGSLKIRNEMWNYVPKVERVIKIPPSMMLQGWMGSDFTNDDLVKESSLLNDYTHHVLRVEKESWVVALTPKPEAAVVWGKLLLWVRKSDFVPLREEFYDEKGGLVRVLIFKEIENVGDRNYPLVWEMTPLGKVGHKTVLRYRKIRFNIPVDNGRFSLKNLQSTR
jgi:outer membrane lipoprotein-sorting protein